MVWQQAHQHNVPLMCVQTGAHVDGDLPCEYSFVEVSSPYLVVSAVKRAEDRDALIVRFWNVREKTVRDARIRVEKAVAARVVNLNEEPGGELTVHPDGAVQIDVPGRKIATIEFTLDQ
jgi:alpha-mannosidase